jgi:pimeloyl-ACP methyl ester carboxylesterase
MRLPSRRTAVRAGAVAALPLLGGVLAWHALRRHDLKVLAADPEWKELRRPLNGSPVEVVSEDGTRLHAEVFGPDGAPTIVLAHGWTCELGFWHYQIRDLAGEFRVVAWDQRGHGRSAVPGPDGYSSDALADDLQAVLLAGHSMGGMTVVAFAGRHPADVERRVAAAMILDSGMGDLEAQSLIVEGLIARRILQTLSPVLVGRPARLPASSTPLSRRLYRRLVMSPRASEGQVAFCEQMLLDCPAEVRAGFGRQFTTLDLYADVPKLTVPTGILVGELDRIEPPWHARKLAEMLPDVAELVELPGIGHMTPIEAPEEVTPRLRRLALEHIHQRPLAATGG